MTVPIDKIGNVIGPGGRTIRAIIQEHKVTIDVESDGTVIVGSPNMEAAERAMKAIQGLVKEAQVGEIYTGKVVRIMDFGAFVEILPGKDGLVHISELAEGHVDRVEDEVKVGDEITVMVVEIDRMGRVNLSRKAAYAAAGEAGNQAGPAARPSPEGGRAGSGPYPPRRGGNEQDRPPDSSREPFQRRGPDSGRGPRPGNPPRRPRSF